MTIDLKAAINEPKQKRGFKRQQDVISAGLRLLKDFSMDELTMGKIAKEANCSVGNLYKRFTNKEGLFEVLLEKVRTDLSKEVRKYYAHKADEPDTLEQAVAGIVSFQVHVCREYRGLIRANRLNMLMKNKFSSFTLKEVRADMIAHELDSLRPFVDFATDSEETERDAIFALQASFGHLINLAVFETGRIKIDDPDLDKKSNMLLLAFCLTLPKIKR